MQIPDGWDTLDAGEREEWFLAALEADPLPLDAMLAALRRLAAAGETGRADAWGDLLGETLAEQGGRDGTVALLTAMAGWHDDDARFKAACRGALGRVFRGRADKERLAAAACEDAALPASECLRRLGVLLALKPGVLCLDKTWGFGVVSRVDDFYVKVTIDFDGKPGHQMSFAYAAETLLLLDDSHILALRHRDAAALQQLVAENPAEVVRMALRSYGSMAAPELRERLEDGVVAPDDWKRFWDAARKALKSDPLVDIPVRRNEAIRLLESEKRYDAAWFSALAAERDIDTILRCVREIEAAGASVERDAQADAILADRLAFVVQGAETRAPHVAAQACLAAERLELAADGAQAAVVEHTCRVLAGSPRFLDAAEMISARELRPLIEFLGARRREALTRTFMDVLPVASIRLLDEMIPFLTDAGMEAACGERLRDVLSGTRPPATVVCWLARHTDFAARNRIVGAADLMLRCVDVFEQDCAAHALKAQNQLRTVFENLDWLKQQLERMTAEQRGRFVQRVVRSTTWDATERRGVMARAIKLYPDLEQVTQAASEPESDEPVRPRLTSWRSYRARQEQLRRVVEVEIPENSKEIGVARSYGDLRENFEYQSARDRQALLMQRKADLERELAEVRASDLAGMPTDCVGMGACVILAGDDGTERRLTVLGEWDRDEQLGIVGSTSRVAEMLNGRQVGDTVDVPGSVWGDATVGVGFRITAITGITPEIAAWITG